MKIRNKFYQFNDKELYVDLWSCPAQQSSYVSLRIKVALVAPWEPFFPTPLLKQSVVHDSVLFSSTAIAVVTHAHRHHTQTHTHTYIHTHMHTERGGSGLSNVLQLIVWPLLSLLMPIANNTAAIQLYKLKEDFAQPMWWKWFSSVQGCKDCLNIEVWMIACSHSTDTEALGILKQNIKTNITTWSAIHMTRWSHFCH